MPFPDDFPAWARALAYVIVAVGLGVSLLVARLGLMQGRQTPQSNPGLAQVASIIVDPAAVNRLTAAAEALNMTLMGISATGSSIASAIKSLARASATNGAAAKALTKEVADLREAIGLLRDEMIRAGK